MPPATTSGHGLIQINTGSGTVSGTAANGHGIFAQNTSGGAGNIVVSAIGEVDGNVAGIAADTSVGADTGSVNVHSGIVTATTGVGILATSNGGGVTVTSDGAVTGNTSHGAGKLDAFWMPFTANRHFKSKPRLLARAEGMHYWTPDGRQVIDGVAGLWCVNAGHCREPIVAAELIERQFSFRLAAAENARGQSQ